MAKFGLPVKAEPFYKDEDVLWGITISIIRDGEAATELGIRFDNEENEKHEWVGRGADGFPTLEGKKVSVVGKHLEIRCCRHLRCLLRCPCTLPAILACAPICMSPCEAASACHEAHGLCDHRKLDDRPIDESTRTCIRNICEDLVAAINKYYAFGSAFADEAT